MQSEEFDKKIIEAADHHHPAYDEQAWTKMEKLLELHLPLKKDDNRKILFLLLSFLLLGGGAWLFISKPWIQNTKTTQTIASVQQPVTNSSGQNMNPVHKDNTNKEATGENNKLINNNNSTIITGTGTHISSPVGSNIISHNPSANLLGDKNIYVTSGAGKKTSLKPKTLLRTDKNVPGVDIIKDQQDNKAIIPEKPNTNNAVADENTSDKNIQKKDDNTTTVINNINITADDKKNPVVTKDSPVKKNKPAGKKNNSFFFSLSTGPDISFLGSKDLGKTKLLAGVGLGYTFKDRVTLKTGFYTGRKVYTASPDEYHPPATFWNYYPYLENVNANCKVYEIPVLLSYNFGNSSKQHWFATTGLSSYLMKKETYTYSYKSIPTGPTLSRQFTLLDINKHYFSVLTLSAGYERAISPKISIMAEPYLKLPLTGIGYGKVKLNSGGILFSVGIKPFSSKKNQHTLPH